MRDVGDVESGWWVEASFTYQLKILTIITLPELMNGYMNDPRRLSNDQLSYCLISERELSASPYDSAATIAGSGGDVKKHYDLLLAAPTLRLRSATILNIEKADTTQTCIPWE